MKASKKIIATLLAIAMVITQVSVFSLAENAYASGLGDGASYALKVPADASVGYAATSKPDQNWLRATTSLGRNADDTGYCDVISSSRLFTTLIGSERFFVLTPNAANAYVQFTNNAYHTYSTSESKIDKGIPSQVEPEKITGVAVRLKGGATAQDKFLFDFSLGTTTLSQASTKIKFFDAATGKATDITYAEGITIAGNADGWLYIPLDGFSSALTAAGLTSGYKQTKIQFNSADSNNKTLYLGDTMFTQSLDLFKTVHAAPDAPVVLERKNNEISVTAVSGLEYSISSDSDNWNTTGVFTGLEEGTNYTIYARYAGKKFKSSVDTATTGLLVPSVSLVKYNSITVNVVSGQEYSINGSDWNQTGIFENLEPKTKYTVHTRLAGDDSREKTLDVTTGDVPYSSGRDDSAFYALRVSDGVEKLDTSLVTASESLSRSEDNTGYNPNGYIHVSNINMERFLTLTPNTGAEGSASIKAATLTYGRNVGFPDDLVDSLKFTAAAIRVKTVVSDDRGYKFTMAFNNATATYDVQNGEYDFIDIATGYKSKITYNNGFNEFKAIDGWIIIPFSSVSNGENAISASWLKQVYNNVIFTLRCDSDSDWVNKTLNVGSMLFVVDTNKFITDRSLPDVNSYVSTKNRITISAADGVELSEDNGVTWVNEINKTGLASGTPFVFLSRYIGKTQTRTLNISTLASGDKPVAPTLKEATGSSISVNVVNSHEYSIDDGSTWNTTGVFTGLGFEKSYRIISRIIDDTEVSAPLEAQTDSVPFSSGLGDGALQLYCIPDSQLLDNSKGEKYISGGVNGGWIGNTTGKNPETGEPYVGEGSGGNDICYFVKDANGDGQLFVDLTRNSTITGDTNSSLSAKTLMGGVGINSSIDANTIKGFAFRVKVTGGQANQKSALDFYFNLNGGYYRSSKGVKPITYVDKATGVKSTLAYKNAIVIEEDIDGWIVIPVEDYGEASFITSLKQYFGSVTVWTHQGEACNSNHGAGWGNWDNRSLYVSDSFFVTNIDQFFNVHSSPAVPELKSKTTTTISVKAVAGNEYSIDQTNWNSTGVFTGLTPNTSYTVTVRKIGKTFTSSFTWNTDMENPPLTAPVINTVTETTLKVNVIPGLEYSVDGSLWNEEGEFAGLVDDTDYTVYARVKGTTETASTSFRTLAFPNPYASGLNDTASYMIKLPETGTTHGGQAAGWMNTGLTPPKIGSDGRETFESGGSIPLLTIDGERFLDYSVYRATDASGTYYNKNLYGKDGFPSVIKFAEQEAFVIRIRTEGMNADTKAFFDFYSNSDKGVKNHLTPIKFIDAVTGEITVFASNADPVTFSSDVNGWLLMYTDGYRRENLYVDSKDPSKGVVCDNEWYQNKFAGFSTWLHGETCGHDRLNSSWLGKHLYVGNEFIVKSADQFMRVHSKPDMPQLESKTTTSINVKAVDGALYRINGGEWQNTPSFSGLTENTMCAVEIRYADGTLISNPLNVSTDMSNPPLTKPELAEPLTDSRAVVKVVPGLEYTINNGESWSELGIFEILNPNTEYVIIARNKVTKAQAAENLQIKTPKAFNPYDRGDGSSEFMPVQNRELGYTYKDYWFMSNMGVKITKDPVSGKMVPLTQEVDVLDEDGNPTGEKKTEYVGGENWNGGYLEVVEIDGEKFINYEIRDDKAANWTVSATKYYEGCSSGGFPRGIWIKDSWAIAFRMKVETSEENIPYFDIYFSEASQLHFPNKPYYLIDNKTKQWKKYTFNGKLTLNGFDGWLILPFSSMRENSSARPDDWQSTFKSVQFFQRASATNVWKGISTYLGDTVIIDDPEKFMSIYAPNTEEPILSVAHNKTTDTSIPAVMANDGSGYGLGDGLVSLDRVNVTSVYAQKPNESSKAIAVAPSNGISNIAFSNDALNYKEITQDLEWQVLDSIGVAFYLEVPKTASGKVGFGFESNDDVSEYFFYDDNYSYYTISDGVAKKVNGKLEFSPGFKGMVMIPFENMSFNVDFSEIVDGLFMSPKSIEYFGFSFDSMEYPAVSSVQMVFDDFMLYQSVQEFVNRMVAIQGGTSSEILVDIQNFRKDLNPEYPRMMGNDCTGIDLENGIYSFENVLLSLSEKPGTTDSYINIKIGPNDSNVMFRNYAAWDEMDSDERDKLNSSKGVSFWLSVPETAPMIVGLDFELLEDESEYFVYDPNTFYYTVSGDDIYKVYGYLEFEPGFEGEVIIPFSSFYFDEGYSDYYDGELNNIDLINYFGLYFSTSNYASIGDVVISVDDFSFYTASEFDYIDAIWSKSKAK